MDAIMLEMTTVVAILSLGIFVQAAAGFAGGLLIVPCMMLAGHTVPEAQLALLVATIPQNLTGVISFRNELNWRNMWLPGMARVLCLPLGVWTLHNLESISPTTLRQLVGGFVLLATIITIGIRPQPRERLHPAWGFLTFPMSGFLQGLVGMGGPVMVLWVQAHDWGTKRSRGFLFGMYLISIAPAILVLFAFFGDRLLRAGGIAALAIPWLVVVTRLGLRAGTRLGRKRLRTFTLVLLVFLGVAGLASPWLPSASR